MAKYPKEKHVLSSKIEKGITVITFGSNVSGIVQVGEKFIAKIGISKINYHLGTFETRELAIEKRLLAEKHLEEGTFENWFNSIKKRGNSR